MKNNTLIIFSFVCFNNIFAQTNDILKVKTKFCKSADTVKLLTGNGMKYWDKVKPKHFSYCDYDSIGWRFKKNLSLIEYYYDSSYSHKRFECIYGRDVIIGEMSFVVKSDTIILPYEKEKYLIKLLTNDTLIVRRILSGDNASKEAFFIKSKDQRTAIMPVLSNITKPSKHRNIRRGKKK